MTGDPYLLIDVGGTNRRASYHSGSTTTQLLFRYTVLAGDDDNDGIAVVANSLTLNGGTIGATDDATAATLDHAALTTTGHKVDIVVTLVSNFGQTALTDITISATNHEVLPFTTGRKGDGYQLDSVVLDVKSPSDTLQVEVRIYYATVDIYTNLDADEHVATLTGSVTTAGEQTFSLVPGPEGNLSPGRSRYLVVVGTGTGEVKIGTVAGNTLDVGATDGWAYGLGPYYSADDDGPASFYVLKVAIQGNRGATPFLTSASIYNDPHSGETFAAGESIEVELKFSFPTKLVDEEFLLPLQLGNGGDQPRGARFVSYISSISGTHNRFCLCTRFSRTTTILTASYWGKSYPATAILHSLTNTPSTYRPAPAYYSRMSKRSPVTQ